jgi:hypothetical protein
VKVEPGGSEGILGRVDHAPSPPARATRPRARTRIVISTVFVAVCLVGALACQSTFLTSYYNFILFLLYLLVP